MNTDRMEELGLAIRATEPALQAELELSFTELTNPVTRLVIERVQFTLVGDRLIFIGPAELVGLPPLSLSSLTGRPHLEQEVSSAFDTHVLQLQRRSAELQALGIAAQVDPETLELSAHLDHPPFVFVLLSDKQGQFRVAGIYQEGQELPIPTGQAFELSEFRERDALTGYLSALVAHAGTPAHPPDRRAHGPGAVLFSEVAARFGPLSQLPARSTLEILVELRVGKTRYRFAAARLVGRSFRGLLAGPSGKLWAERFELDDFPGAAALLAQALGVPVASVETLPPPGDEK